MTARNARVYGDDAFCLVLAQGLGLVLCSVLTALDATFLRRRATQESLERANRIDFAVLVKSLVRREARLWRGLRADASEDPRAAGRHPRTRSRGQPAIPLLGRLSVTVDAMAVSLLVAVGHPSACQKAIHDKSHVDAHRILHAVVDRETQLARVALERIDKRVAWRKRALRLGPEAADVKTRLRARSVQVPARRPASSPPRTTSAGDRRRGPGLRRAHLSAGTAQ